MAEQRRASRLRFAAHWGLVFVDLAIGLLAITMAFVVRFSFDERIVPMPYLTFYLRMLPFIIVPRVLIYHWFGKDLWGLSESQETVSVSPAMFEEFVFPYQLPVISRFGLSYYGCCEPVNNRWHIIKQIPNLRRVSVSPWADEEAMAANLGHEYIYCRKPNPAYVSTKWDEALIREDLRNTLTLTKGQPVEFALKDVHTLAHEPWRLGRWCDIAREEIARIYG
jgi:hypothetical protein